MTSGVRELGDDRERADGHRDAGGSDRRASAVQPLLLRRHEQQAQHGHELAAAVVSDGARRPSATR
jgi:hypothetical protein